MSAQDDVALIRRAFAGDPAAHRDLITRLRPSIHAEIGFLLMRAAPSAGRSPRQDLEDLVQDTFVKLWERDGEPLLRWDPARGRTLDSYVRLVTRSRALDMLRSRKRNPWQGEPMDLEALEGVAEPELAAQSPRLLAREQLLVLWRELEARLSVRDQQLFWALFVEDGRPADVAAEAGMSADAVYQWASRFRRRVLPELLRIVFGEPPNDDGGPGGGPGPVKPAPVTP